MKCQIPLESWSLKSISIRTSHIAIISITKRTYAASLVGVSGFGSEMSLVSSWTGKSPKLAMNGRNCIFFVNSEIWKLFSHLEIKCWILSYSEDVVEGERVDARGRTCFEGVPFGRRCFEWTRGRIGKHVDVGTRCWTQRLWRRRQHMLGIDKDGVVVGVAVVCARTLCRSWRLWIEQSGIGLVTGQTRQGRERAQYLAGRTEHFERLDIEPMFFAFLVQIRLLLEAVAVLFESIGASCEQTRRLVLTRATRWRRRWRRARGCGWSGGDGAGLERRSLAWRGRSSAASA